MQLFMDRIDSELSQILIISDGEQLCSLDFADYESRMMTLLQKRYANFELLEVKNPQGFSQKIQQYFRGDWRALDNIPVNPGGTPFQQTVWSALRQIPPGITLSYQQLAVKIGKPTAARAVGMANAQNPIAIVIPCHRVIAANTKLAGYAGGIERKRWLLNHEAALLDITALLNDAMNHCGIGTSQNLR
ncbi:MAG: methylated-DNA--[protein]-cysteine S-methyltransferase [Oscillatoriales cyanobacterium RM2_1_1]|nr:methylated-DNA--[protein]-cysteine S-methyltransferase [Oscillatoriales cyanobacterium SM2_3_0]NJO47876.1 methylated-DNA--[protein]-cysteine S-methyltransferase [Oscillatoriales cyanobacterium RM2_1_1]